MRNQILTCQNLLKQKNQKKFFNSSGKVIGTLEGAVFTKSVRRSKHFLRALQAWGTDKQVLEDLKAEGCAVVKLIDRESGLVYEAPLERILAQGTEKDLGFGVQVFLPEKEWQVKDPGQLALFKEVG